MCVLEREAWWYKDGAEKLGGLSLAEETMSKVEHWGAGSRVLFFGWLVVWALAGACMLLLHNPVMGLAYLGLLVVQYISPVRDVTTTAANATCSAATARKFFSESANTAPACQTTS